jgi:glycosyltransferase involved in cell wall biosynthesis
MKILILTQKVNRKDSGLGFFHSWIEEFGKNFVFVTVICLEKGEYSFAENINILSMGKENRKSRLRYLYFFYKFILRERKKYDCVFVHMNTEYVILGILFWFFLRKKIYLWYAHTDVNFKLRLALFFSSKVFTSTENSFPIKTNKLNVVGQGIDSVLFKFKKDLNLKKICTIGRITKIKNLDILIDSIILLHKRKIKVTFDIFGEAIFKKDLILFKKLNKKIEEKNISDFIKFKGSVFNYEVPSILKKYGIFLNASQGALDKAIIEAGMTGRVVITSNIPAKLFLPNEKMCVQNNKECFLKAIIFFLSLETSQVNKIRKKTSNVFKEKHNVSKLISNISKIIES